MAVAPVQRRLAAILAADVVGYSRLVREDEEGTLSAVKSDVAEAFDPNIEAHNGRIFKTMGDGLLVVFASVVDAVRCAVKVQRAMADRNADRAEDRKIEFRIGINLGDVVAEGEDLHGDGVNVAARLEGLAEPGGIWISGSAFEQVRDKLEVGFEDLGDRRVKNIDRPVRAYRVAPDQAGALAGGTSPKKPGGAKRWRIPAMAALALAIVAAGGLAVWRPWAPTVEPASVERMALPLPDKPSIAVLAFDNLSGDPGQDHLGLGIAETLITDLSGISGLFVAARNSSFAYRGRQVDVRTIGRELGVRYVIEGSVQLAGGQLRINAQLIEAETGGHLRSERYDGSLAEIFDLQDKLTGNIVSILALKLTEGEKAQIAKKETASPEAYDEFLKGWEQHQLRSPEGFRLAIKHFNKAIELDPDYSRVYAALAATYWEVHNRYWHSKIGLLTPHEAMYLAETMLEDALRDPTPLALQISAMLNSRQGFHDDAIADAVRAVSLDPNDANGYVTLASVSTLAGEPEKAVELIRKAMRLNPHFPSGYLYELGLAHFTSGQYSKAADELERASALSPEDSWPGRLLIAVYGQLDRQADVDRVMSKVRLYHFGFDSLTIKSVAFWYPFKKPEHANRLAEGLRKAGVPD